MGAARALRTEEISAGWGETPPVLPRFQQSRDDEREGEVGENRTDLLQANLSRRWSIRTWMTEISL